MHADSTVTCPNLRSSPEGNEHAFWCLDVLHRLFDDLCRARHSTRGAWLRIRVGGGAFAHPHLATFSMGWRWRAAEAVLRRDGSIRDPDGGGGGDEDAEGRHWRLPGKPARHDAD